MKLLLLLSILFSNDPAPASAPRTQENTSPQSEVDRFHPDREVAVTPGYGGTVRIHFAALPKNGLCYPIESSAYGSWILDEVHESLLARNFETWEFEPVLAKEYVVEDALYPKDGSPALFGRVDEDGSDWLVTPLSTRLDPAASGAASGTIETSETTSPPTRIPKERAARIERGTVFTLRLRDDVLWHDGHAFDAYDVVFSSSIYRNRFVDCDSIRSYFEKIVEARALDEHTVRLVYDHQYFKALETVARLPLLPAHLYDLHDSDHPKHDAAASAETIGKSINTNPANFAWVGLGPYRVTSFTGQSVIAERFEDYFDAERAGYFDRIQWRAIRDSGAAWQALLEGEVDFHFRLGADQYFGEATRSELFTERFYKGYYYTAAYNYVAWNMLRPGLSDVNVRRALAHAFDLEEWVRTAAHGLAEIVTGPQFFFGPSYNHDIKPYPFDLERARELLAEAGWIDRNDDGIVDRDGVPLELEFPHSGLSATTRFAQKLQENLAKIGVRLELIQHDWSTFHGRVLQKDFDVISMAWSLDLESDPEQYWHSRGAAPGHRGSNRASVADPYIDGLIERGQRELDPDRRHAIWREMHRYLHEEVQPYLFREMPPRKFALNRAIRGFQAFQINPGFSIRRWFYPLGTNGTRAEP